MADVIHVQQALVTLAAQAVYPNGTGQASVAGVDVKVYPGWPTQSQLDADLSAGKIHVTVYPLPTERNTTRFQRDNWQELSTNAATITATVNGQLVTIGGTIPAQFFAQNVSLIVNGLAYVYATQAADTPISIATALAALIPGASSSLGVITLPATAVIGAARVGVSSTLIRETRRQERLFMIAIWTDTPTKRDAVSQAIDVLLATTQFLTMPDTFAARLIYRSSMITDDHQKAKLYRRDLNYSVEYATTEQAAAVQITQLQTNIAVQPDGATVANANVTINT